MTWRTGSFLRQQRNTLGIPFYNCLIATYFLPFWKISTTYVAESLVYSPGRVTAEKVVQGLSGYKLVDYFFNRLYSGAWRDADQVEPHYKKILKQSGFCLTVGNWTAFSLPPQYHSNLFPLKSWQQPWLLVPTQFDPNFNICCFIQSFFAKYSYFQAHGEEQVLLVTNIMNQAIFISSLFSVSIHSAEFVVNKLKLPRKNRKMERIEIYIGRSPEVQRC